MDLSDYRQDIDEIDKELLRLFQERMDVSAKIAEYKRENSLPVLDPMREREKMASLLENTSPEFRSYTHVLYSLMFELSRSHQGRLLGKKTALSEKIASAIENTQPLFPETATVACQGTEGAYSQLACEKLFKAPSIMYMQSFDNVFSAIESGLCRYGMLPLENSSAGSVNQVYDLMQKHKFSIVKSVRLKVDHNLYVNRNVNDLSEIREIISHEQAIMQCDAFIKSLGNVKITYCDNTAQAAKMVANSNRCDIAAIASQSCGELYNLKCLKSAVQDNKNNYTRFICISKNLEIYPGAGKTSLMMTLSHRPGSLYKILARIYSLDINLLKLESRPMPDRDFEFMFYFDIETSIYSKEFAELITELSEICEEFSYLGSYSEVM